MTRTTGRRGLSNWLAGVVVGVAAGVLTLTFPTLGWLIVAAFLVGVIQARPRLPAVSGLSIGFGATWLALFARSYLACERFDAAPNQECIVPDLSLLFLAAALLLAVGIGMTAVVMGRGQGGDASR